MLHYHLLFFPVDTAPLTKAGAIKYFRTCVGLQDIFHNRLIMHNNLLEPILDIVIDTMPRDNLLNSACLELFEFVRKVSCNVLNKQKSYMLSFCYCWFDCLT